METGTAELEHALLDDGFQLTMALFDELIAGTSGPFLATATATDATTGPAHAGTDCAPAIKLAHPSAPAFRRLAPAPVEREDPARKHLRDGLFQPKFVPAALPQPLREQDRLLPMANVARLMHVELPEDAKVRA